MAETKYLKVYAEKYGDDYSVIMFPNFEGNTMHPCVKNKELFLEDSLIEKAREDGQNEAWEFTRKICMTPNDGGLLLDELKKIYGTRSISDILRDNTYSEALAKYNAWEDSKKINIWDEVRCIKTGELGTVINRSESTGNYHVIFNNKLAWLEPNSIEKTGRARTFNE